THVDACKHDLMLERGLNEARQDPPDIDVDFAWDERDGVLERVFSEYGDHRVGRVANHNRYDWRGAFRASARALGYSDDEITRHLRESPSVFAADVNPGRSDAAVGSFPVTVTDRTKNRLNALRRQGRTGWNEAERLCRRLMDIPHCLSMHCGGVVISRGPLARVVPTVVSRKGLPTIQWEKDGAEDMGLIKIDLLGNRSLAVIRDAVRAVAKQHGIAEENVIEVDPTDDLDTQELVKTGQTFGVFYLESPSMRLLEAKAGKGDFAHAVVHSSIIRPAANAFINEYIARLRGKDWKPLHEKLHGLFEESKGIPVYQEDVVKLAMHLANYDYARAEALRKCLGKRDARQRLTEAFPALRKAALANGVDEKTIRHFWHVLMSMTGYSFCKPHSASLAQVSYEAAYLRAHYPAHFIAAVLSNGGGYYSTQSYVSEAMRLGLAVLGPDVNASHEHWVAEGDRAVRVGLMAISGLSRATIASVVGERERCGRYRDLDDFFARNRLPVDDLRRLALVGGLDSLAPQLNRPQLVWCVGQARQPDRKGAAAPAPSLFDRLADIEKRDAIAAVGTAEHVPDLPPYTNQQRWETEYTALSFIPGRHPMIMFADEIRESVKTLPRNTRLVKAGDLSNHVDKNVTILAWPVSAKIVETKHGDAMMFQSFEDQDSLCETVIFPQAFKRYHHLMSALQPLWVTGKVIEEFDVATLQVSEVRLARRQTKRNLPLAHVFAPG
ncbi:MAG: DNA polymerase III subunit alpha, partial [Planctomycetes bacterium]|nr:DNA polymerase III subunit alpha [Planctomycetota bacterium]